MWVKDLRLLILCGIGLCHCAHGGGRARVGDINAPALARRAIGVPFSRVGFPTDSDRLMPRDRPALAADIAWLQGAPERVVLLEGHADARGPASYNVALGDRRARAIARDLLANGVSPRRIVGVVSRGESAPLVRGAHPSAWAKNRRVELIVW